MSGCAGWGNPASGCQYYLERVECLFVVTKVEGAVSEGVMRRGGGISTCEGTPHWVTACIVLPEELECGVIHVISSALEL